MKKRKLLTVLGVAVLILTLIALPLAACAKPAPAPAPAPAPTPAPAPAKEIVLKAVTYQDLENTSVRGFKYWMELVNERGKGKVRIEHLGGQEVITYAGQWPGVSKGVVDIICTPTTGIKDQVPEAAYTFYVLPFTAAQERENGYHAWIDGLLNKENIKFIGHSNKGGTYSILLKKKIARPQELAGMKLRAHGTYLPFAKALGIVSVTVDTPELYSSLEQGIVEGTFYLLGIHLQQGLYEVTKYIIEPTFWVEPGKGGGSLANVMNLDKWNSLPKDVQDLLMQAHIDIEPKEEAYQASLYNDARAGLIEKGMEVIEFTGADREWFLDKAITSWWDDAKARMSPESYQLVQDVLSGKKTRFE